MKGFIEVNIIYRESRDKMLVNIKEIVTVKESQSVYRQDDTSYIVLKDNRKFDLETTYEEIKQKIKEATEPKLMIDENGNLKEIG